MIIKKRNSQTYLIELNNKKEIKIPSQKHPLTRLPMIFNCDNTEPLNNELVQSIYDGFNPKIGRCYDNSEQLYQRLIQSGIEQKRLKIYVGWLFIFGGEPIHHAMIVLDDKYVLDYGVYQYFDDIAATADVIKPNGRKEFIQRLKSELEGKPHSQSRIFGKAIKSINYVVSEGSGQEGIQIRNRLIKAFPNHPAFFKENEENYTDLQNEYTTE